MVRLDARPIGSSFRFRNARRHRLNRRSAAPHSVLRQGCGLGRRCGGLAAEQRGRGPTVPPVRCGGGSSTPMRPHGRENRGNEGLPPAPCPQPQNGLHQARQRRGRLGGGGGGGGLPGLLRPARLRGPDTLRARGGPVRREQPPPPLPMPKTPSFVFAPVAACPRPANTGLGVVQAV